MASNTYTGDLTAAESRIKSLTQAVSSGVSGLPGVTDALRKQLYEREKTLPGLEKENEAKIQELYTADKRLAETYSNPESNMFIENPNQRQALISGQKADIRGELGNILNLIQQRQLTLGNAIDKGMELYKMGLEAHKLELEQAEKEWDRIFKKQEAAKTGKGTNYSAYQKLLEAYVGGKGEQAPAYSPTTGIGSKSAGGEWTYTGKGVTGWEHTGGSEDIQKLQRVLEASKTDPQVAALFFSNESLFSPQEDENKDTDSQIAAIASGGMNLNDFSSATKDAIVARAIQKGYEVNSMGEIVVPGMETVAPPKESTWDKLKKLFSAGTEAPATNATPAPTESVAPMSVIPDAETIRNAQAQIDRYQDPLQRADVYQQITSAYPDLKPYLRP